MDEPIIDSIEEKIPFVGDHRFGVMITVSILISLILAFISLAIYSNSGAAQLDLSRPGYNDVRADVDKSDNITSYSSVGAMNYAAYNDFKTVYGEKANRIILADVFSGDPLSPIALGFESEPIVQTE